MQKLAVFAAAVAAFAAGPALADIRVCETTIRGPAGEHTVRLEVEDGTVIYADALWAPPRQNARANVEFPRIELRYRITDFETGARSPLLYVVVTHAVRMTNSRAETAEVTFGAYGEDGERQPWDFYARARDPENTGLRNSDAIAGSVAFNSRSAREIAQTAPQLATYVITDQGERLADGVFLMTHRPALGAMLDHAFGQARRAAANARRDCRAPRHDERLRSQSGG